MIKPRCWYGMMMMMIIYTFNIPNLFYFGNIQCEYKKHQCKKRRNKKRNTNNPNIGPVLVHNNNNNNTEEEEEKIFRANTRCNLVQPFLDRVLRCFVLRCCLLSLFLYSFVILHCCNHLFRFSCQRIDITIIVIVSDGSSSAQCEI